MRQNPPIEGQISWVYTRNLVATDTFYEQVLALDAVYRTESARIYATSDGAYIGVCMIFGDRVVEPKGGMITLLTDNVDGWHEKLSAAKVNVLGPPERHALFDIYAFVALDPNGYRIEFQKFLDPEWNSN